MLTMTLSEAMRLGAIATHQGFIADSGDDPDKYVESVNGVNKCAWHAAELALGAPPSGVFPWANPGEDRRPCPAGCRDGVYNVFIGIIHLNDHHRWTREAIADWVEGIERAQEQPRAGTVEQVPVSVTTSASAAK